MADDKIRISWDEVQSTQVNDELRRPATTANAPSPAQPWTTTPMMSASPSILSDAKSSSIRQFLPWIIGGGTLSVLVAVVLVAIHFAGDASQIHEPTHRQPSAAAQIESVLQQDAAASAAAKTVIEVVSRMRAIDLTGCPNDFKSAYLAHIHAWELMVDVEREAAAFKADSESGAALVESFIRGFLGDPFGKVNEISAAQNQLQKNFQTASQQVRDSFHRVEELAVSHGANLPKHNR